MTKSISELLEKNCIRRDCKYPLLLQSVCGQKLEKKNQTKNNQYVDFQKFIYEELNPISANDELSRKGLKQLMSIL